jgi:hypothetical protein
MGSDFPISLCRSSTIWAYQQQGSADLMLEGSGDTPKQDVAYKRVAMGSHCHQVVVFSLDFLEYLHIRLAASDHDMGLDAPSLQILVSGFQDFFGPFAQNVVLIECVRVHHMQEINLCVVLKRQGRHMFDDDIVYLGAVHGDQNFFVNLHVSLLQW